MFYSNHIASKLGVWRARGQEKLKELLAKMGFPLEESKQKYAFMSPKLKSNLRERVMEHAGDFGLDDLTFSGFVRVSGYRSLISASDTSHAITALLENDGDGSEEKSRDAFNAAYDALNMKEGGDFASIVNGGSFGNSGVGLGLRLSMELQRVIVNTAVSLVEKEQFRKTKNFRSAQLNATNEGANGGRRFARADGTAKGDKTEHIFAKPFALCKLATFLFDMHRENGKWANAKALPLVLMAENPATDTYLVCGFNCPSRAGEVTKNSFGRFFLEAASIVQAKLMCEKFDSNVVEVPRENLQHFFEQLNTVMGA